MRGSVQLIGGKLLNYKNILHENWTLSMNTNDNFDVDYQRNNNSYKI